MSEHTSAIGELRSDVRELRAEMIRRFEQVDARFDRLEDRFDRRFNWLIGLQFTTLLAVLGVVLTAYFR